jgi:hypothetical protein
MQTQPQIYPKNPKPGDMDKPWRVWFRFFHGGKHHQIVRCNGLSSITNFKDRLARAKAIQQVLKDRLAKGWNPVTNSYPSKTPAQLEIERLQSLCFTEALDFAFLKKKSDWRHKTAQDYQSVIKYLKKASGENKPVREMRRADFKQVLELVSEQRSLSNIGYNKYREFLSSLIGELIQWEVVEYNYIRDIRSKPVQKTIAHRPPSQDQRLLIVDRIKNQYRNYYRFLAVLYGCTIRPIEITRLQVKHLHKLDGVFRIPASISKNKCDADVPIPNWVMDLLSELNLHKYGPDDYIFSTRNRYGTFLPGPHKMHSNTPTTWWKNIVKKDLGLEVNQYSLKKLSGDDMVRLQRREGADRLLDLPMEMMRHANTGQTEDYVTEHKTVIRELIQQKMPEL